MIYVVDAPLNHKKQTISASAFYFVSVMVPTETAHCLSHLHPASCMQAAASNMRFFCFPLGHLPILSVSLSTSAHQEGCNHIF